MVVSVCVSKAAALWWALALLLNAAATQAASRTTLLLESFMRTPGHRLRSAFISGGTDEKPRNFPIGTCRVQAIGVGNVPPRYRSCPMLLATAMQVGYALAHAGMQ